MRYIITGINNPIIKKNVDLSLQNYRSRLHFPLTQEELQRFSDKGPKFIRKSVAPYGYFKCQTQSILKKTEKYWLVQFNVTLGPTLPITALEIHISGAGKNDPEFIAWKKHLPFRLGQALQTDDYENAKSSLYNVATRRGYFSAKMIKTQIQINLTRYQSTIIIDFNTGPRYRFGETTFTKSPFYDSFLHHFLTYHAGEYYNADKLETTQEGLVHSDYFDQVTPKIKLKEAKNNVVPIEIAMIPRRAKTYTLGAGYGTDTGVRGTMGITLRQLGHKGHRFKALIRGSQTNSTATARYMIPGFDPAHDLFSIGTGASYINQSTGSAHNAEFALSYARSKGKWKSTLTLAYLDERYNILSLPITSTSLVYPTFSTKYINADNAAHPNNGISFEMQFSGADKNILSQTNFFQATAHLNTLYTISDTHTRLLFRTEVGHTSIANIGELPLSLQLFAGGVSSVRGYGYNSIGPGRNLVVASSEVQQRIIGAFYLAGLVDAGVVANNNIFYHINVGTGPGIAWISPIGTMELTYVNAFTQSNTPWTIQFTMGTTL
ncbi:MAG: BamA/TamA family outer membrane protein [Gammaproteobacteria bacterium]|nr:BamA/TamA family outer membrane protein [Gammaproteobacteria bacterium]